MKILFAIYCVIVNMAFDMSVLSKFGDTATQQQIVSHLVYIWTHIIYHSDILSLLTSNKSVY